MNEISDDRLPAKEDRGACGVETKPWWDSIGLSAKRQSEKDLSIVDFDGTAIGYIVTNLEFEEAVGALALVSSPEKIIKAAASDIMGNGFMPIRHFGDINCSADSKWQEQKLATEEILAALKIENDFSFIIPDSEKLGDRISDRQRLKIVSGGQGQAGREIEAEYGGDLAGLKEMIKLGGKIGDMVPREAKYLLDKLVGDNDTGLLPALLAFLAEQPKLKDNQYIINETKKIREWIEAMKQAQKANFALKPYSPDSDKQRFQVLAVRPGEQRA